MSKQYTTLSKAKFKQAGWLSYCYFPLKRDVSFYLDKFESIIQGCFVPSLVVIDAVVREKTFDFGYVFSLSSPLGKGRGFLFHKFEFPLHEDALCQVWLK